MGACTSSTSSDKNLVNEKLSFRGYGVDWEGPPIITAGHFTQYYSMSKKNKIGEGAYGNVYVGFRQSDKMKVAVKETKREGKGWESNEEDLMREVKVLQKLDHPNILKIYDFFIDEKKKRCFVVLEFMRGGDLFDTVVTRAKKQSIPFNELEARGIMYVTMKALEYMHDHDIVHRDIKPENLLLLAETSVPTIKIADYGFADKETMIKPGVCGTSGYMAPEIILGRSYGKPVDVFSLGVVMFILLAGYPPYWKVSANTPEAINEAVCKGMWDFEGANVWKHVTPEVKNLIQGMMHLNPDLRLSIKKCLAHEWMEKAPMEFSQRPLDETMKSLRSFNAKRKFQKHVRGIMAANRFKFALSRGFETSTSKSKNGSSANKGESVSGNEK